MGTDANARGARQQPKPLNAGVTGRGVPNVDRAAACREADRLTWALISPLLPAVDRRLFASPQIAGTSGLHGDRHGHVPARRRAAQARSHSLPRGCWHAAGAIVTDEWDGFFPATLTTAGTQSITVTDAALGHQVHRPALRSMPSATTITVNAGSGQDTTVNTAFATPLSVLVTDDLATWIRACW